MRDLVAAEWWKLRTARSTAVVVGSLVVVGLVSLGIAASFVATWDGLSVERRLHASMGSLPALVSWIGSLVTGVLGVVAVTSEFGSGMIRTTLAAMPRRGSVLAAKGIVVGAVVLVASALVLSVTLVATEVIIGERPIGGQPGVDIEGAIQVSAMALSMTMFALLGVGLGTILRSGLASIVVLATLWYVAPLIASNLPAPLGPWLSSLVPGALAGQLTGMGNVGSVFAAELSPLGAAVAMLGYAVVPLAIGVILLDRTDV